ncbi:hypothetical protein EYF80_012621 [Liparis tanakae]|uniref:Uncharacterized protein n=1 Tax=Liparis tanakae TaxID=230148 RepID=A0A4Z2IIP8_9TELE|nr:hypothetical protein EYF80_012621 [Liparis tanakae]
MGYTTANQKKLASTPPPPSTTLAVGRSARLQSAGSLSNPNTCRPLFYTATRPSFPPSLPPFLSNPGSCIISRWNRSTLSTRSTFKTGRQQQTTWEQPLSCRLSGSQSNSDSLTTSVEMRAIIDWVASSLRKEPPVSRVESGSLAVTVPMTVLTGAFSFTSSKYTGLKKIGGSSESSTTIFTVAVSLKGPPLLGSERTLMAHH